MKTVIKVLSIGFTGVLFCFMVAACSLNKDYMTLKAESFTFEYGEVISLDAKDYVTSEDDNVLKEALVEIDGEMEDGKQYYPIGEYSMTITYEKEVEECMIIIEDTTLPVFKDFKESIEIEEGNSVDFLSYFSGEDLSETEIVVDQGGFDANVPGEYTITVTLKDISGNETSKQCKVIVKEKKVVTSTQTTISSSSSSNSSSSTPTYTYDTSNPIVAAALAQVGNSGQCALIVENSINAVGLSAWRTTEEEVNGMIYYNSLLSPETCRDLGYAVSTPQPGDIVYYTNGGLGESHVAIYIGNGMCVHGNFDGICKVYSANIPNASAPQYYRLSY